MSAALTLRDYQLLLGMALSANDVLRAQIATLEAECRRLRHESANNLAAANMLSQALDNYSHIRMAA